MLQCPAECCSSVVSCVDKGMRLFLRGVAERNDPAERFAAVCCSVLQCVVVCCSVLQFAAVCCRVLQGVAVCGVVLHCVAVVRTEDD